VRPDGLARPAALPRLAPTEGGGRLTAWLDWPLRLRDRLLASPRFQRWAADFPLTRPIADRRARALFDLCAGFVFSQVLLACVELGVSEILAGGPRTVEEMARRLALSPDRAERLLRAAVALRLVEYRTAGRFGLGSLGAALLGNPGVAAMIEHHRLVYTDLADPVALLRGKCETGLSRYWPYAGSGAAEAAAAPQVAPYTALMAASQALIADDILDAYPICRHRCILDVGGGDGAFLAAAADRGPRLRLLLFDLPAVAAQAAHRFAAAGLARRAEAVGGNFLADPLPRGADVITLVRVLHDHDDGDALTLLRAIRRAVPPRGVLLIAEPLAGARGTERVGDAYFGFYLCAMGRGRARRLDEIAGLLAAAGFGRPRRIPTRRPLLTSLVMAQAQSAKDG
jgi:demethylspheroidene O-methyltransferase